MKLIKIFLLVLIFILPIHTYASDYVRTITVTGKSETVVEAQYAIINLDIKHVRNEMNLSHDELMKTISKLTIELEKIGLADADIKKSLILQGQEYSWEKESRVLKGYYSECLIDLYVKDINKIAAVYKELANYRSITINGTEYKRNDEFDIRKTEFEKALQAAKKKAEYMARALDRKIGKVYSIQEVSPENYVAANLYEKDKDSGGAKAGFGNIKISAMVVVEFELE
ncbi:MAG: SIMPL domain-containing protein [Deltaproteobacteria bacterium]|nr:SIMPL domain-containing protein [Deltaproteobacteria bacterium]